MAWFRRKTVRSRIRALAVRGRVASALLAERGSTLVVSVGVLSVTTVALGSSLTLAVESGHQASYANDKVSAFSLAEAGINNAVAVLNASYPGFTAFPGDPNLLPARTTQYPAGSATWSGTLQHVAGRPWQWQWSIASTGHIANPAGGREDPASSTAKATVPVVMPLTATVDPMSVLNFIYAGTDVTFRSSVQIASPVYATRDLRLEQSSAIQGSARKVGAGRDLYLVGPQNQIGLTGGSDPRIGEVHVAGHCSSKLIPLLHTCGPVAALWDADKVYATTANSSIPLDFVRPPALTCCAPVAGSIAPTVAGASSTLGFWYQNASPGPYAPCDPATKIGTPPTFDTGDNTINNSGTPTTEFNLTPTASYTCKTLSGGNTIGELSWNASTKVLTVKGTMFIDGSATIDGGAGKPVFSYSGEGTIYLSGTFSMKTSIMCAVPASNDCNFTTGSGGWKPNEKALIIIADGDGGFGGAQSQGNVVGTGIGIQLVSSSFQGALIANKSVGGGSTTTSNDQGPIISVYGQVVAGQTGTLTFPSADFAPAGTAGVTQPIPPGTLLPAVDFS